MGETRLEIVEMELAKDCLFKIDELSKAERVFRHYVSFASLSMEMITFIKRGNGSSEEREIVAHMLGEITMHFRNDFGQNPPWENYEKAQ